MKDLEMRSSWIRRTPKVNNDVLIREEKEPHPVWLRWMEHQPIKGKVINSIPKQDTSSCRFCPQSGQYERQPVNASLSTQYLSPSPSPSFPLSLKSLSMSLGED